MAAQVGALLKRAAVKLNDSAREQYTDAVLLPLAQDAADELQIELELNGLLVLEKISTIIVVPINTTDLKLSGLLPPDMLEPQRIEERLSGTTDQFVPMTRRMWEPDILPTDSLRYWVYREENILFVGATSLRDIKIYYLKKLILINDVNSVIAVNNCEQFMVNRIAALAANFIGENPTRALLLDGFAGKHLEDLIRVGTKSKQGTRTRRRPFVLAGRRRWV